MEKQKGFTLIELLVVIAIIGLLSTLAVVSLNNARAKSRDSKRIADVKQMQTALELYFNESNSYPTALIALGSLMPNLPSAPTPNDGTCSVGQNTYTFTSVGSGAGNYTAYTITYCLGGQTGGVGGGYHTATPSTIAQ